MRCCGREIKQFETLFLYDTVDLTDRRVYIGYCINDNCKAKVVEYVFYNRLKQKYERHRPKRKDVENFIREIKTNPYLTVSKNIKKGSKDNMYWHYQKAGNIYDFNETLKGKV